MVVCLWPGNRCLCKGEGGADGPRLALFRPKDLVVTAQGEGRALTGRVTAALYRGGYWEAKLAVDGLTDPVLLHLPRRAQVGDELALRVSDGWLLPE